MHDNKKTILIAGGGTGGHIYPALAIAKAIVKKYGNQYQVEFVGTEQGLESKLVPRENFVLHFVPVGRLNVGLMEKIITLLQLPYSIFCALWLVWRKKPRAVLGVGGYASAPVVLAAAILRYPTYIWEPNAYPGLANRWLSRFVQKCMVVFASAGEHLLNSQIVQVAMPVREEMENLRQQVPRDEKFRVLIFGGSQGARAINKCVAKCMQSFDWRRHIHFIHQTGRLDYEEIAAEYKTHQGYGSQLEVYEYLHDMPDRYAWADLIVCRSGTGTLSELAAASKAAILVPLPTAADDHQRKNAEEFVKMGAARLLPQDKLTPERLIEEIVGLMNQPEEIEVLKKNIYQFHKSGSAEKIADIVLGIS